MLQATQVPHVGVIGFSKVQQITHVLDQLHGSTRTPTGQTGHTLAVGASIRRNTLPTLEARNVLADIHNGHPTLHKILHFVDPQVTRPDTDLHLALMRALNSCDGCVNTLVIDLWSDIGHLVGALQRNRYGAERAITTNITLRIGMDKLKRLQFDPERLVECILQYWGHNCVDGVLFDFGEERLSEEQLRATRAMYRELRKRFRPSEISIGVAKSLAPHTPETLLSIFGREDAADQIGYLAYSGVETDGALDQTVHFYREVTHALGKDR